MWVWFSDEGGVGANINNFAHIGDGEFLGERAHNLGLLSLRHTLLTGLCA